MVVILENIERLSVSSDLGGVGATNNNNANNVGNAQYVNGVCGTILMKAIPDGKPCGNAENKECEFLRVATAKVEGFRTRNFN
jgi:hypothetical protein